MCSRVNKLLPALMVLATATSASAQICGFLELDKARKRESQPTVEKGEPEPLQQLAPKPAANPHAEVEQAVERFQREAREYSKEVAAAVQSAFQEKRATVDRTYEKHIRDIEAEEREYRAKAMAKLEEFIAEYADDPQHTPARMAQLGELYFEESGDAYAKRQDEYEKALEEFKKTKTGKEPEPPLQRFDKTIAVYRRLVDKFPDYRD